MMIRIVEDRQVNRKTLRAGKDETIMELRDRLRRRGMDPDRKLRVDFTQTGYIVFTYDGDPCSAYAFGMFMRKRELTPEERYHRNLRVFKDDKTRTNVKAGEYEYTPDGPKLISALPDGPAAAQN